MRPPQIDAEAPVPEPRLGAIASAYGQSLHNRANCAALAAGREAGSGASGGGAGAGGGGGGGEMPERPAVGRARNAAPQPQRKARPARASAHAPARARLTPCCVLLHRRQVVPTSVQELYSFINGLTLSESSDDGKGYTRVPGLNNVYQVRLLLFSLSRARAHARSFSSPRARPTERERERPLGRVGMELDPMCPPASSRNAAPPCSPAHATLPRTLPHAFRMCALPRSHPEAHGLPSTKPRRRRRHSRARSRLKSSRCIIM